MANWPQYFPWLSGRFAVLMGPLLGLMAWWAEGPSFRRKPRLSPGSDDDTIWDTNYSLNRLLLGLLMGTGFTVVFATLELGRLHGPLDFLGAFLSGFLVLPLGFWLLTRPQTLTRYAQFRRFNQLRYGYNANNIAVVALASVLALAWLTHALLRV